MFNEMEIKIANATSRSGGASAINKDGSIRAIVPRYVAEHINKEDTVLDFGAGKGAVHTKWLREEGFNVTAYDFGDNIVEGLHDKNALQKQYKVIMASNVLNVCSTEHMLMETLIQISNSLVEGGMFICNYPASPRKLDWKVEDVACLIRSLIGDDMERVGGSYSAPLWVIKKSYIN
jgi:hypothetical protein